MSSSHIWPSRLAVHKRAADTSECDCSSSDEDSRKLTSGARVTERILASSSSSSSASRCHSESSSEKGSGHCSPSGEQTWSVTSNLKCLCRPRTEVDLPTFLHPWQNRWGRSRSLNCRYQSITVEVNRGPGPSSKPIHSNYSRIPVQVNKTKQHTHPPDPISHVCSLTGK